MDECTHIKNYTLPYDPSLAIAVAAENDAYQPKETVANIPRIWPGSQVRWVQGDGHIVSYLFKQHVFRKAIYDVLDKTVEKYYGQKKQSSNCL